MGKLDWVSIRKNLFLSAVFIGFGLFLTESFAASGSLAAIATKMSKSIESVAKLIGAGSYVAGLGFAVGAIMKFKQHKDNPTQIPVGTPIALVFIAAALIFLPSVMSTVGDTMFGDAKTAKDGFDLGGGS